VVGRGPGQVGRVDAHPGQEQQLDIARAWLGRGESVTMIAAQVGVGRSTLCRALEDDRSGAS
jgi:hypothetical protein